MKRESSGHLGFPESGNSQVDWLPEATNEVKDALADFAKRYPDRVEMKDGKLRIKR